MMYKILVQNCMLGLIALQATIATATECPPAAGVAVQVLGSGGPIADDARASSAYLVWVDGTSRILIDAGGGAFLRFAEASAQFEDLEFVGLSHLHVDHSTDLAALLKSGYFSSRSRELIIAGPTGSTLFPGLRSFLDQLLDENNGAYRYLSGYRNGDGGLPRLLATEVGGATAVTVFDNLASQIQVDAIRVPHGIVPALAFRVRIDDTVIVFAGDQNGKDPRFAKFAVDADVLVMHMAVSESTSAAARQLHAQPSKIGKIAGRSRAKMLILSHFMARSLSMLDDNINIVRGRYSGPVIVAEDLLCQVVTPD